MSMDKPRLLAPLMSKTQVAVTGPLFWLFCVSTMPKNTSKLLSLMMPTLSDGKIDRLSSRTPKGMLGDTQRWYFSKPSPAEANAPAYAFVCDTRFRLVEPSMSEAMSCALAMSGNVSTKATGTMNTRRQSLALREQALI